MNKDQYISEHLRSDPPSETLQGSQENKTTIKGVAASRNAGRIFILSISAIVIVGGVLASIGFNLFISQQELTNLTREHDDIWRQIQRNIVYVMGRSEGNPISIETAQSLQNTTAKLMVKEKVLKSKIDRIIDDTKAQVFFMGTTQEEKNAITNSDVDPEVREQIERFITASPAVVRVGFSFWDTSTIVKVHSDRPLQRLHTRVKTLSTIQSRNIKIISRLLLVVVLFVLLGIWIVWNRLLNPNLKSLEKTIHSEHQQMIAKELATAQLGDSERELRTILDNTPGMIASIDKNYCYISANKAYIEHFRLGKEEFIVGKPVKDVLGEQTWNTVRSHMERTFQGERVDFGLEVPFPTGSRHVEVIYVPEERGVGPIQRIYTLIIDDHERYLAQQALRASEEKFMSTLDSIGDGVIATDKDGIVTFMNPVAENLTGLTAEEAIKEPLETVLHIEKEETDERMNIPTDNLLQQDNIVGVAEEKLLISKDGVKHQVSDSTAPIKDSSGEVIGKVLVIHDVTEDNKLRVELNQNMRLQSLGRLAGGISHDFNNLLAAISGAAEVLLMGAGPRLTEKDCHYIDIIFRTTKNAANLIKKLVSFSRKAKQKFSPLDINSEVKEVYDILSRTIDQTIEIVIEDEAINHMLQGNSSAIQNSILNICINATHAMPAGGKLTILIRNQNMTESQCNQSNFDLIPGNYIDMRISDTGVGIKKDQLDKIFDPYFTTKPVGSGSGIGLSTVYGTIVEHKGAITVQSVLGEGSEFRVLLPCTEKAIEKDQRIDLPSPFNNLGTILLIDDNDSVREIVGEMLKQLGGKVMIANDGIEGIALYKKNIENIDLVMMDINMPKMSGVQAITELKLLNPECIFIAITGFSESEMLSRLDAQETPAILQKPFTLAQLADTLHRVL